MEITNSPTTKSAHPEQEANHWQDYPDKSLVQIPPKIKDMSLKNVIKSSVRIYNELTKIARIRTTEGEVIIKSEAPYEPGAYVALHGRIENGMFVLYIAQEQLEEGMIEGPLGEFVKFTPKIIVEEPKEEPIVHKISKAEIYVGSEFVKLESPMFKLIGFLSGGGKEFFLRNNFSEDDLNKVPSLMSGRFIDQISAFFKEQIEEFDDYNSLGYNSSQISEKLREIAEVGKNSSWHFMIAPYVLKNEISFLRVFAKKTSPNSESRRVVMEFDFAKLGKSKIDAIYTFQRRTLLVKFLSESEVEEDLERKIKFAFDTVNQNNDIYGNLTFHRLTESDVSPMTEILDSYCKNRVGDYFA